jgi:hypothetical protein
MEDRDLPILRQPRRSRTAEAFLASRLAPGETVTATFRVQTGSLLAYLAIALPAILLWFAGLNRIHRSRFSEVVFGVVYTVGYVAIILIAQWLLMKPRMLALTDRRLFILRLSPPFGRVAGVEAEGRRESVRSSKEGGRLLVSGVGERPVSFRIPWGDGPIVLYLKDWAALA